jgi:DNA-binding LytR/AlgR family response regulator
MGTIRIGIVEDEMIISETIAMALEELQYQVSGVVGTYKEAIVMLENTKPDLVLLDINLGTKKDGIDLAFEIQKRFNTPIIFLTANSDPATISRAKEVNPLAFLVKPFSKNDLFSAIEIGWNNFNTIINPRLDVPRFVILKVGNAFKKVVFDDIVYLEKDRHYFDINLISGKKLLVRYTTSEMIALLPAKQLIKINKSHIVNVIHISNIESRFVYVADLKLLMAKGVQKELLLLV